MLFCAFFIAITLMGGADPGSDYTKTKKTVFPKYRGFLPYGKKEGPVTS